MGSKLMTYVEIAAFGASGAALVWLALLAAGVVDLPKRRLLAVGAALAAVDSALLGLFVLAGGIRTDLGAAFMAALASFLILSVVFAQVLLVVSRRMNSENRE